jgi:hypothetical protein
MLNDQEIVELRLALEECEMQHRAAAKKGWLFDLNSGPSTPPLCATADEDNRLRLAECV